MSIRLPIAAEFRVAAVLGASEWPVAPAWTVLSKVGLDLSVYYLAITSVSSNRQFGFEGSSGFADSSEDLSRFKVINM